MERQDFPIAAVSALLLVSAVIRTAAQDRVTIWSTDALDGDKTVTVLWEPQCFVTVTAQGNGTVDYARSGDDWYPQGTNLTLVAMPADYYAFAGWDGATQTLANPLTLVVERPCTNLVANFTPLLTTNGTPYLWYVGWGVTNEFEWHDATDADGDGRTGHEEYVWGTNPLDPQSYPRLTVEVREPPEGLAVVLPESATGRTYWLERTSILAPAEWVVLTNAPGQAGDISFSIRETNATGFYRATAVP